MMLPRVLCPRATTTMAAWLLLLLSFLSLSVTLASCASSTAPLNSRKAASVVPTAPYHVVNLSRLFWQDAAEESRLLDRVLGTPLAEAFLDLTQAPRVRSLSQAKLAITRQPSYESYSYASPLSSSPPSSLLHQHQQQQQTATPQAMRAQHHGRSNSNSNSNNNVKEEDDGRTAVYTTIYVGGNAAERDEHYCSNYPYHHTHRHTPRHDDAMDEKNSAGGQWTAARRYTKLAELAALLAQLPPSAVGKVVRQWRSVDWPVDLPQLHLVYAEDNKSSLVATATTTTRASAVHARDVRHTASDAADGGSAWAAGEAASGRAHGADEESSSSSYGDEEEEGGARKRVHVMNDAKAGRMATLSEVYDALALHTTTTTTTTRMTSTSTKAGDALLPRTASEAPAWRSSTTLGSAALHSQQQAQAHAHDDTPATAGETDSTAAEHHSPHHSYSENNNNNDEDGDDDNDDARPAPRSFLYNYYPNEYHEQAAAAAVAVEDDDEENIPRMPLTQFRETVVDVDDNRAVVQLNITKFGLTVVRFTGHKGNVINSVAQLRSSRYDRDVPMDNCQGMALAIQLRTKWSPMMSPMRSAAAQNAQRNHAYDVTTAQHPYVKRSMQYKTAAYTNDNNNNNNHHARYGEDDNNNDEEGAWGQLWSSFALLFESSAFCEILPSISMRVSKAPREEYYYLVIQSGPGSGFDRHTVSNCLMEVFIDQTPARRQLTQQLLFALVVPVAVLLLPMPLLLWRADYVQEFMIDMDFTEWIWSPPYVLRDAVLAMALWVFTKVRNAWVVRKARRRQMRLEAQHKALLQGFFGGSTANNNNNNGNARQSGSTTPYLPLPSQGVGREGAANREEEDNNSHHRCREGDERDNGISYADRTAATATSIVITTAEGDAAMQGHGPRAADAFMEDRTRAQAVRERPLFALPHDINNNRNTNTNDANAARSGPPHAALPPAITSDATTTITTTAATSTSGDGGHGTGAVEMHSMTHTGSPDERRSEAGMAHDAAAAINSIDDEKKEDAEAQPRTLSSPPAAAAAAAASAAEMTALRMNVEGVMAELHYDGRAKPHDLLFPTNNTNTNTNNTITSDTNDNNNNEGTTTVVVAEEAVSDAAGTVVAVSEKADGDKSGAKKTHEEVNEADEEEMNGERLCRICREGEEEEPLVAPCACTGSVRWVHRSCLDHWRLESAKRNLSNVNRCEICKQPFKISIRRTTLLWQGSKHIVRNALLLFACLVCTFGITALVHGVMGGISCTTPYHRASYRNMYNLEGLMLAFIVYAMAMFMFFFAYMIVYSWFRGRREIEEYIAEMHIVPPFMNTRYALYIAVVSVVLFAQVLATGYLLKLFLYATSSIIWNWEASPMVGGMLYGILMTFALAFGGVLRHSIEERREQRRQTRAQDVVIESSNNTTATTTTAANDDNNNNNNNNAAGAATTAQAGNDEARPATPYPQEEQQTAQAQQRRRRRPRADQNTVTTAPSSSSSGSSSNDESGASHAGSEAGERAEEEEGEHNVSAQARRTSPHANNTNTTTTPTNATTTTTSNGNAAAGTAGVVQDYNDIFNVPAELRVIRAVEYCPPRRAMPSP